jgi:DNA repair photolyase
MFNYQVDPYIGCEHVCHYCYALNNAQTDWEKEILLHEGLIERLPQELSKLEPQTIYIGMDTDPYQPSERTLKQTKRILELLAERDFSVCILTKSGMVTRDIDLLAGMPGSSVGVSIAFQNEQTRQLLEKNAPPNKERLESLIELKNAGIETYTLISPVMPFITNVESLIDYVAPYSDTIWIYRFHLESEDSTNWQNVQSILDLHFPELTEQYRKIAFSADHPYWLELRHDLERIQNKKHINLRIEL